MKYKPILPKRWNSNLAYIFGLLIGDGSLPKTKSKRPNGKFQKRYHIYFISESKKFIDTVYDPLFNSLFGLNPWIETKIRNGSKLYISRIESKEIYEFFQKRGFTVGRKARIATVPKMPNKYHIHFLAGLFDTDGGKKGSGFGLCTASKHLALFCIDMLKKHNIPFHSCPWKYKDHTYHQIYVGKRNMWKVLKTFPIKQVDKISFIKTNSPQ
ncbi:MAG TPA: LAGLIDADG family homing endonuclease [Candidatus Nanoarchaeia archaeon]|nr:LAGLIDADG family homing endonuclease [Candidatus Nanoarchaeia archaeon]